MQWKKIATLETDARPPGTLDVPPPPGTQVKVLHEHVTKGYPDGFIEFEWHLARVLTTSGTKAIVSFENGLQSTLDLDQHAVRLADYVSEDEGSEVGDERKCNDTEPRHNTEETTVKAETHTDRTDEAEEEKGEAKTEQRTDRTDEADEDSESDGEQVPGTLDEAPAVGTLVKVLYDDERWYPARVTASRGIIGVVIYEDKVEEELNFDEHAVRLIDYVDEDEQSEKRDEATTAKENIEMTAKSGTEQNADDQ